MPVCMLPLQRSDDEPGIEKVAEYRHELMRSCCYEVDTVPY
jgi:hypothetical protein